MTVREASSSSHLTVDENRLVLDATSLGPAGFEEMAKKAARQASPDLDVEAMALVFNLMRTQARIMQDLETHVQRPAGTTWAAFRLMALLRSYGPMAPQEIARVLHVSASSVSAVVKTLERYGWVARSRISRDGRVVTVTLTPRGEEVVDELQRRNNHREVEWASGLQPDERKTLVRLLHKVLACEPSSPRMVGGSLLDAG
jgi:DNA-binding MarR family transcriptional regulator